MNTIKELAYAMMNVQILHSLNVASYSAGKIYCTMAAPRKQAVWEVKKACASYAKGWKVKVVTATAGFTLLLLTAPSWRTMVKNRKASLAD